MHEFTAVLVRLVVRASDVGDHAGRAFGHPGCTVCNKTLDSFSCFWCLSHKFINLEFLSGTCVGGSWSDVGAWTAAPAFSRSCHY